MSFPILSIIIPIYNGEKYIERLIDSLIQQNKDYLDIIEVILINDGSRDDSEKLCMSLKALYPFIYYYYKENGGIADARNFGLKKAIGKYVAFCDQDDTVKGGYFPFINILEDNTCDILISNYFRGDPNTNSFKEETIIEIDEFCDKEKTETLARHMLAYGVIPYAKPIQNRLNDFCTIWNCVFRMQFIKDNNLCFKKIIDYEDDWRFITESLFYAENVFLSSKFFYCWTNNPNSESHRRKFIDNLFEKYHEDMVWNKQMLYKINVDPVQIKKFELIRNRLYLINGFLNACLLTFPNYLKEIKVFRNNCIVKWEQYKYCDRRVQKICFPLLYLKMYSLAYILKKLS